MHWSITIFQEHYQERPWAGVRLREALGRRIPDGISAGEAWLIADHPTCESIAVSGPHAGKSLRWMMERDASSLMGSRPSPTRDGRFPLLLKLIDAGDVLSVQVHPDDEQAQQLGELDGGKTEMWHIIDADADAALTSGLHPGTTRASFEEALLNGEAASMMHTFPVSKGDAVFLAAGGVHAIGGGILLAEIQQNSNITYRLFDWNRVDSQGKARELHIDKALSVMDFNASSGGRSAPLRRTEKGSLRETLAACRYFAAEKVSINGAHEMVTRGASFHIALALDANLRFQANDEECFLRRGEAALIPACVPTFEVQGIGAYLDYYVPDLVLDIIEPLRRHGYDDAQIAQLGGVSSKNDLKPLLK